MHDKRISATAPLGRAAIAASAIAIALGATACGEGDGSASERLENLSENAVATVGDREIAKRDLDKRVAALRRAQPRDGGPSRRQLEQQAMAELIRAAALEQEAEERDLRVTRDEVLRRWTATTEAQFPTRASLRRFLGRRRRADILFQLRLQALTDKIQDAIRRDSRGDAAQAVEEFQRGFQERWQDRTACRERYAVASCG